MIASSRASPGSPPSPSWSPSSRSSSSSRSRAGRVSPSDAATSTPRSPRSWATSGRWSSARCWPSAIALDRRRAVRDRRSRCSSRTTRRAGSPRSLAYMIDLLAAVPSVVFGLWGGRFLGALPAAGSTSGCTSTSASSRSSAGPPSPTGGRCSPPAIVLAIMILPIITAISREVFAADPAPARGGGAGPRCHPLGDDPVRRSSPTPAPAWSPASCSASAARSARRWRSRWSSPTTPTIDPQPDRHGEPADDRGEHRAELQGGDPGAAVAADRHRPGAVRGHLPGQLRGALGRRPQCSGSWRDDQPATAARSPSPRLPALGAGAWSASMAAGRGRPRRAWSGSAGASVELAPRRGRRVPGRACRCGRGSSRAGAPRSTGWSPRWSGRRSRCAMRRRWSGCSGRRPQERLPGDQRDVPDLLDAQRDRRRAGRHLPRPDRHPADHRWPPR